MSTDDDDPPEPFGGKIVREMHRSRLKDARSEYKAIINRLWAGCGGGSIAVVTAVRHPTDPFFWLSAGSFGLGVALLGVGAFLTLMHHTEASRHLEDIDGILKMRSGYAERPSAQAGLSVSHPQTWTALMAAGLFIVGVLFAGVVIARH